MTFQEELDYLRANLIPYGGTGKVVGLNLKHGYFKHDFIKQLINQYEQTAMLCLTLGQQANPLEQLAIHVLRDSAHLETYAGKK